MSSILDQQIASPQTPGTMHGAAKRHKMRKRSGLKCSLSRRDLGMDTKDMFNLCDRVRETAFELQSFLRHGHAEKVYENGLAHRLEKQGLQVDRQVALEVRDEDGTVLGSFVADLLVEGELVVELKAIRALGNEHTAQILGYLRAARLEHGLLINFGAPKLQVRKFALSRDLGH